MSLTMAETHRPHVPMRLDVDRWATRQIRRRVLAVVHTVTAGQRLLDAVRLLEGDARVQVFFTPAPDVFSHGVDSFLEELGGLVLPWHQAVQLPFDLALSAAHGGLNDLHAPVIVLPHGAGHNKLVPAGQRGRPVAERGVYGLNRQWLVQDGRLVPESIVLAHHEELTRLGRECPEALPAAEVVGDPALTASPRACRCGRSTARHCTPGPGSGWCSPAPPGGRAPCSGRARKFWNGWSPNCPGTTTGSRSCSTPTSGTPTGNGRSAAGWRPWAGWVSP